MSKSKTFMWVICISSSICLLPSCLDLDEVYEDDEGYETAGSLLGECKGDCDSDSDCRGDLLCFQRERNDPRPPGCPNVRTASKTDFCFDPDSDDSSGDDPGNDDGDFSNSWTCGEKNNQSRNCSSGNDLKAIIKAKRRGNKIEFEAKERLMSPITFTVNGTRVSQGPRWVNYDGRSSSSKCAQLNCGSGVYACVIVHDDPQDFSAPSGANKVAHKTGHGNSVTAMVGRSWSGGRVNNRGSTDGGNNDITAAFCVR